jgi:hypothetical protein
MPRQQQQRRQQRSSEHTQLPAQPHIRRHPRSLRRRPRLGDEGHANAEFAAQSKAGNSPVSQQVRIALRQRTQSGKHREDQDGPREHPDPAEVIAQHAEDDPARHRANQRPGHERARLRGRKMQVSGDHRQHEAEDEQIEAVHRIAEHCREQSAAGIATLRGCAGGRGGRSDSHRKHPVGRGYGDDIGAGAARP